jgi:hypothetical protein
MNKIKVQVTEDDQSFIEIDTKVKAYFPNNFENVPTNVTFEEAVELITDMDLSQIGCSALENLREEHKMITPTSVFVVIHNPETKEVMVTTRPYDKTEDYGLPGGKLDPNEGVYDALYREAIEEGVSFDMVGTLEENFKLLCVLPVRGKPVAWYKYVGEKMPTFNTGDYREKIHNIYPLWYPIEKLTSYMNDVALKLLETT